MLSRIEFLLVEEKLKKMEIPEIENFYKLSDSFITSLNAIENNKDTIIKIGFIIKSELRIKDILQFIISKINPDLNILIEFHNEQNNSYKLLTDCIGIIQGDLEDDKEKLINGLSNKEYMESNRITNTILIEIFSSKLKNIINSLILSPIKEAIFKYNLLEEPATKDIIKYPGEIVKINKDRNLFWFLVFCYMLRSSQFIGYLDKKDQTIKRQIDVGPLKKLIRSEIQANKQKNESGEGEGNPEESKGEEDSKKGKEEINEYKKQVKVPDILSFGPQINGSEEYYESPVEGLDDDYDEDDDEDDDDEGDE